MILTSRRKLRIITIRTLNERKIYNMTGLVLEGGTFRGIFSAGVMDAFLAKGIEFQYIAGVSAGISNAASYVSKQFGRNIEILEKYRNDRRYLGVSNFLSSKSIFGLDFVFDKIPNGLIPFDYEAYRKYKGRFLIGVTNAVTGGFELKDGFSDNESWQLLRASCAIPGFFPAIPIDGGLYFDGGLACPIPAKPALKDGCGKLVILLTQPGGFIKKLKQSNIAVSRYVGFKYPEIKKLLLIRHKIYNRQLEFISELEKRGKALIIRPSSALESFQKDTSKLRAVWREGYDAAINRMDEIKAFIE